MYHCIPRAGNGRKNKRIFTYVDADCHRVDADGGIFGEVCANGLCIVVLMGYAIVLTKATILYGPQIKHKKNLPVLATSMNPECLFYV